MKTNNNHDSLPPWQSLRSVFKTALLEVAVFSFFVNILLLATPIYSLQIFDRISTSRSYESLIMLLIAVMICVTSLLCFEALRKKTLQQTSRKLAALLTLFAIQQETISEINSQKKITSPAFQPPNFSLDQLDRMCRKIESPAILGLIDTSLSPLFILLLFVLHPLFGITIVIINALLLIVCALQHRSLKTPSSDTSKSLNATLQWFKSDYLSHWIRSDQDKSSQALNQLFSDQQRRKQCDTQSHQRLLLAIISLRHIAQITIPTVGGILLITQEISMGVLLAAMMLSMKSVIAWEQLFQHGATLVSLLKDCQKLKKHTQNIHKKHAIKKHNPATHFTGTLSIELPTQEKIILKKGTRTAIIGPCGSGKSSLLKALIGITNDQSKTLNIYYDDYSIATLNRNWFGHSLAFVRPNRELPNGTIRNFILANSFDKKSDTGDDSLVNACQITGLHSRIISLKLGYDSDIENEPYLHSPGVISLLLLARALAQNPDIIFIDDIDASLDKAGLEGFERSLDYLKKQQCSVIFTTQRKTLVNQCDHVLLNDNNRVYHVNPNPQFIGNPSTSVRPILQQGA